MNRIALPHVTLLALLLTPCAVASVDGEALQSLLDEGAAEAVIERVEAVLEKEEATADALYWLAQGQLAQIDKVSVFRKMGLAGDARDNLEAALALDANHVPARVSLGQYYLQAPAIAGGSVDKAMAEAEALMTLAPAEGYRLRSDIARESDDPVASVDFARKALAAGEWAWESQYSLVVQAVHYQVPDTVALLDEAEQEVRRHLEAEPARLALLDYQRGKYAATSGQALDAGHAALKRYLATEPAPTEPPLVWAEFRLAQVERQLGDTATAEARLADLELRDVPESLGFALQDERRWHYDD